MTHALSVALAVWFHPDLFVERILHHFWPELLGVSLALCAHALLAYYTTLYEDVWWGWLHREGWPK